MRMPPTTGFTIRIYPSTSTLLLAFAQLARGPLFLCCHAVEDIKFFCQQLKLVASAKQMGVSSYLFLLFPHNLFPTPLTKTGVSLAENFVCLILRGRQTPLHSTRGPSWLHGWKWTHRHAVPRICTNNQFYVRKHLADSGGKNISGADAGSDLVPAAHKDHQAAMNMN